MHSLCSDCEDDTDGFGRDVFLTRYLGPITAHYLHRWRSSLTAFWNNISFADFSEHNGATNESSTSITDENVKSVDGQHGSRVADSLNWLRDKYRKLGGVASSSMQAEKPEAAVAHYLLDDSRRPNTVVQIDLEGTVLLPKEHASSRWLKEAGYYIGNVFRSYNKTKSGLHPY
jgi:hypothetical protein